MGMEMSVYDARMAAHDATVRKDAAGERLLECYPLELTACSDSEYVKAQADYREAVRLEGEAWRYSWKREREERY